MSSNKEFEESSKQKKEQSRFGTSPTSPLDIKETRKAFDIALGSMIEKFMDCPVCQGVKEYCPTPQMGYARCPTRLRAGRGGIRRVS